MDRPAEGLSIGNLFAGISMLVIPLVYVIVLAVVGSVIYFAVRLAVLHALKAHTRWLDQAKP